MSFKIWFILIKRTVESCTNLHLTNMYELGRFFILSPQLVIVTAFIFASMDGWKWDFSAVSICNSLIISEIEHVFMSLFVIEFNVWIIYLCSLPILFYWSTPFFLFLFSYWLVKVLSILRLLTWTSMSKLFFSLSSLCFFAIDSFVFMYLYQP